MAAMYFRPYTGSKMLAQLHVDDPLLRPIAAKVLAGETLSAEDGLALYQTRDIHAVGRLANFVRNSLHGDQTFYNRNRHINYTNVCALSCKFCSFYRKRGEEGAYEMSVEQVVAAAQKAAETGATEVHIVGGLHPWLKFDYYLEMLSGIRRQCPRLHIKAFTAIEIIHFSRISRKNIRETLTALREAGLGSLPGGGAEIFDDRVHDEVFKGKVRADSWFEVHRTAHDLGIPSNATMLYGHVETPAERVKHLIKLRELQAESVSRPARFNCVIPLSFIPEGSELGRLPGPTGLADLRTLAIARLLVNNIPHIKAFWIMQGVGLSQLALNYGCDDLDGTVVWYDITKREGERNRATHQELGVREIRRVIRQARRVPVERDTLYQPVRRDAEDRVVGREVAVVS